MPQPESEPVFGNTSPEAISRLFGIDEFTVVELQFATGAIEGSIRDDVQKNPANSDNARAASGYDDTNVFVQAQLFGEIPGELL